MPGRFAKPCGLRALRVRIPCLPLFDWPDSETEITPGFYPGSPGSNPGWANVRFLEGPPDWRRDPVGSRSSMKVPCGFNSRSFRCGRVRCWFPETDCESVWQRFDSARSPSIKVLQASSWESSQPPKLTHGVRILTLVLQRLLRNADVARLRKASVLLCTMLLLGESCWCESSRRLFDEMPRECGGCMTAFEAVGRGSIPRWGNHVQQVLGV